jgi:hypothetical protein
LWYNSSSTVFDFREAISHDPKGSAYCAEKDDENVYLAYASIVDDLKRLITEPPKKPTPTPTFTPTVGITATATATSIPAITPTP